ncbi:MAG: NUDIX domain-containing protein [Gemmatimonadota bacterium]|nr:NUDIX domain-containing protein [Gemmatimonadota bacterium]
MSEASSAESWRGVPAFGSRIASARYALRPSAYAIIADENGRLAVVRTPEGIFLPGGGIDPGETPAQAAVREAREECGLVVRARSWSVRAVQLSFSKAEDQHFEKQCTFLDAAIDGPPAAGIEADHELVWLTPAAAAETLSHDSHSWAVDAFMSRVQ